MYKNCRNLRERSLYQQICLYKCSCGIIQQIINHISGFKLLKSELPFSSFRVVLEQRNIQMDNYSKITSIWVLTPTTVFETNTVFYNSKINMSGVEASAKPSCLSWNNILWTHKLSSNDFLKITRLVPSLWLSTDFSKHLPSQE